MALRSSHYSLVVIGAGPAGMAAAKTAANLGVRVALLDEQAQPGGQIYRNLDRSPLPDTGLLGRDYMAGRTELLAFRQAEVDYQPGASVWYLDGGGNIGLLVDGENRQLTADKLLIAVGAQERPMPFPGWQLPGVMSAGAGQILLKSAALLPEDGLVLAGNGPLLLLMAWQYLRAGVSIRAIIDTSSSIGRLKALVHLPQALGAIDYLWKGIQLIAAIRRAGIPVYHKLSSLVAEGEQRLERVRFTSAGKVCEIETRLLLVHQGVIPNLHLSQSAGCEAVWNPVQQCWATKTDRWGQSSVPGYFVAGDAAGIVGARAATLSGQITGLQLAHALDRLSREERDRLASPLRKSLKRHLSIRPLLDARYRVAETFLNPPDETMVCRCEEVFAKEIREVASLGCTGPNQAKAFTRCGMGPCQGRLCGPTVAHIISAASGESMETTGLYRVRTPVKPISLGQLAGIEVDS